MGFTEFLTIAFIVLKLLGVISWSWWLVFLPEIIAVSLYLLYFFVGLHAVNKTGKHMKKHFDEW